VAYVAKRKSGASGACGWTDFSLIEITGKPYYTFHPFITERLPCFFFWINKAKIYVSNDTAWYYLNNTPNMKYLFKRKFDKKRLMIKLTGYHRKKVDLKYFDKSLVE
jgi:hypothetical protein